MHPSLLLLLMALLVLSACASTAPAAAPVEPTIARLPTVTAVLPTQPPPPALLLPTAASSPTAAPPTATPAVQFTEAGPVTASMAQLGIAGEPYAILGDPQAPITVVEFADFGCEFCRRFHILTFGALRAEYIETGKVLYVFKDLPVTSRHGALAAAAAECAGSQGRYWETHSLLFSEPDPWYGSEADARARINAVAAEAALNTTELNACIDADTMKPNIDANFAEAQALRIYGTPAYFVNGKLLVGAQPPEVWREILDRELTAGTRP